MNVELHITRRNVKKLLRAVVTALFQGKACVQLDNAEVVLPKRRRRIVPEFWEFPADES